MRPSPSGYGISLLRRQTWVRVPPGVLMCRGSTIHTQVMSTCVDYSCCCSRGKVSITERTNSGTLGYSHKGSIRYRAFHLLGQRLKPTVFQAVDHRFESDTGDPAHVAESGLCTGLRSRVREDNESSNLSVGTMSMWRSLASAIPW